MEWQSDADKLCSAAACGNEKVTRELLEEGVSANARNSFGQTPLQVMCTSHVEVARQLLEHGADPNVRDGATGMTPAHDVAREGFLDTLQLLLLHGADLLLRDAWGNTAAHKAAAARQFHVVRYLSQGMDLDRERNGLQLSVLDLVMQHAKENPRSLRDIARLRIRDSLGHVTMATCNRLPLPANLRKILLLQQTS